MEIRDNLNSVQTCITPAIKQPQGDEDHGTETFKKNMMIFKLQKKSWHQEDKVQTTPFPQIMLQRFYIKINNQTLQIDVGTNREK